MIRQRAFIHSRSHPSLWVTPYVRGRLVFAAMAARALQEQKFDKVLIDLPCFMNQPGWLDTRLNSFPLPSSLLVKGDSEVCSLYPLVPTDAACAAAWLARSRSIDFECVDPMAMANPCGLPSVPIPVPENEPRVSHKSPVSCFDSVWLELDARWQNAPDPEMRDLIAHGESVGNRISERLATGRAMLFVCEYRLWWAVRKALELPRFRQGKAADDAAGGQPLRCAVFLEDPYLLWAAGLFDDYLAVNRKFHESLESGNAAAFDKFSVLAGLLAGHSRWKGAANGQPASANSLTSFIRRYTDTAGLKTAETKELGRLLHEYPVPTVANAAKNPPEFFRIAGEGIFPSDQSFDLVDVFHARPFGEPACSEMAAAAPVGAEFGRDCWLSIIHPVLTRQEAKKLGPKTSDARWAVAADYELHTQACSLAREAAMRAEDADLGGEELGWHTPVMFVFQSDNEEPWKVTLVHDSNPILKEMELRDPGRIPPRAKDAPDCVYSLYAGTRALEHLFEGHIERELITSLTLLFTGRGMGIERYAAITGLRMEYQCRMGPTSDPDLKSFQSLDRSLAWALKYAIKNVLAVSCPGWEPSPAVQEFAARKSKRILALPLEVLPDGMAERLSRLHFISNALKTHPECERIIARFVG